MTIVLRQAVSLIAAALISTGFVAAAAAPAYAATPVVILAATV